MVSLASYYRLLFRWKIAFVVSIDTNAPYLSSSQVIYMYCMAHPSYTGQAQAV